MTEAEFNKLQADNSKAVAQGKPPLIEVAKTDLATPQNDVPENIPPLDDYLQMLAELRNLGITRLATRTLNAADTSINLGFSPRKHLIIKARITGKSANTTVLLGFNNDTGANYLYNVTANNPSNNSINLDNASSSDDIWSTVEIANLREKGKMALYRTMRWTGSAAGSSTIINGVGVWDNVANQITSIQITLGAGGGVTMGAGSCVDVYGYN